jgi:mono/diheme cytochrome c family protein
LVSHQRIIISKEQFCGGIDLKQLLAVLSILLLFGLLWTVSAQEATEAPVDMSDPALIARGQEVFVSLACTACHGQNGEGTDIAPALAGHSEFAIRRQARAPIGIMTPFSPIILPAEDLDAVVAYILSLEVPEATEEAGHEHVHAGLALGDFVFAHHWLLWLALQENDAELALEQIQHIKPFVAGAHLVQLESLEDSIIRDWTDGGNFEEARDLEAPMVADVNVFGASSDFVYLQMIYRSLLAEDAEASWHFMNDYLTHTKSHDGMQLVGEANLARESGDFEAAAALLEAEYGDSLLFENAAHEEEAKQRKKLTGSIVISR